MATWHCYDQAIAAVSIRQNFSRVQGHEIGSTGFDSSCCELLCRILSSVLDELPSH